MKLLRIYSLIIFLVGSVLFCGCSTCKIFGRNYDEIPPMLDVLTKKVQVALEKGYYKGDENALLEYVAQKDPNTLNWFVDKNYEIRVSEIAENAVVLICDDGKALFEDTSCKSGPPDRDYRNNSTCKPCEITMTLEEVKAICE